MAFGPKATQVLCSVGNGYAGGEPPTDHALPDKDHKTPQRVKS